MEGVVSFHKDSYTHDKYTVYSPSCRVCLRQRPVDDSSGSEGCCCDFAACRDIWLRVGAGELAYGALLKQICHGNII